MESAVRGRATVQAVAKRAAAPGLGETPGGAAQGGEDPFVGRQARSAPRRAVEAAFEPIVIASVGAGLDVAAVHAQGWRAQEAKAPRRLLRLDSAEPDVAAVTRLSEKRMQPGQQRLVVRASLEVEELERAQNHRRARCM